MTLCELVCQLLCVCASCTFRRLAESKIPADCAKSKFNSTEAKICYNSFCCILFCFLSKNITLYQFNALLTKGFSLLAKHLMWPAIPIKNVLNLNLRYIFSNWDKIYFGRVGKMCFVFCMSTKYRCINVRWSRCVSSVPLHNTSILHFNASTLWYFTYHILLYTPMRVPFAYPSENLLHYTKMLCRFAITISFSYMLNSGGGYKSCIFDRNLMCLH